MKFSLFENPCIFLWNQFCGQKFLFWRWSQRGVQNKVCVQVINQTDKVGDSRDKKHQQVFFHFFSFKIIFDWKIQEKSRKLFSKNGLRSKMHLNWLWNSFKGLKMTLPSQNGPKWLKIPSLFTNSESSEILCSLKIFSDQNFWHVPFNIVIYDCK